MDCSHCEPHDLLGFILFTLTGLSNSFVMGNRPVVDASASSSSLAQAPPLPSVDAPGVSPSRSSQAFEKERSAKEDITPILRSQPPSSPRGPSQRSSLLSRESRNLRRSAQTSQR